MRRRIFFALATAISLFAVSEVLDKPIFRDMYEFGQVAMAAMVEGDPSPVPSSKVLGREVVQPQDPEYSQAIKNTAEMVWDESAIALASQHDLNILNVTWEDTGRFYNSAVGPNISDVTIQIQHVDPTTGEFQLTLMPVIRYPNFSDLTADIPLDRFFLLVGNEDGSRLQKVTLKEYLGHIRNYLSKPGSWAGRQESLLADRDSHVLVSAQAAFLPVPKSGKAEFNPVIFNYQSYKGDPAVLTIVATREGTSATVIDNLRDGFSAGYSWGQRLFFNQAGERASFTGERLSDFRAQEQPSGDTPQAAGENGLNLVLIIQVPLKQKHPLEGFLMEAAESIAGLAAPSSAMESDIETAVIGHGEVEGPFTEIDGLDIERDTRFPIRVTVQFYKATGNGVISEADVQQIADQIERVYQEADYVGSLVVDGASDRPTEYEGQKEEPAGWWDAFWRRFEENTGLKPEEARQIWQKLRFQALRWSDIIHDFSE